MSESPAEIILGHFPRESDDVEIVTCHCGVRRLTWDEWSEHVAHQLMGKNLDVTVAHVRNSPGTWISAGDSALVVIADGKFSAGEGEWLDAANIPAMIACLLKAQELLANLSTPT